MSARLRLLFTVLLVGAAVLMMHVEAGIARPDGHHAAAPHTDDRNCPDERHCDGGSGHRNHFVMMCSMMLLVLGGVLLIVRRWIRQARDDGGQLLPAVERVLGVFTAAPRRPPDLAALAVMRC